MKVHSSYGTLVVDALGWGQRNESEYDGDVLKDIERFDLKEYKSRWHDESETDTLDILELGYWITDGSYIPPLFYWGEKDIGKEY